MKSPLATGLTILRNGVSLGYPFLEAIRAALPLCDEYIVVVGDCQDGTREAIEDLKDARIRIVDTVWSPHVTPRKCLLAQQTNVGLNLAKGRWCVAVQAEEVLHESDVDELRGLMQEHVTNPRVEGFLFERLTYWADYEHVLACYPHMFKYTPRIVRTDIGVQSIRDAMSFAVFDGWSTRGRYPRCLDTGSWIHRLGHVRRADVMERKFREAVHHASAHALAADYFQSTFPEQFVRRRSVSLPAVLQSSAASFPSQYSLGDARNRRTLSWQERARLAESDLYRAMGVPKWRNSRFQLVGDWKSKPDRPA